MTRWTPAGGRRLTRRWITVKRANAWIDAHHSHHKPVKGATLCIGAFDGADMVGCAVMGRPSAPLLDDGAHWEVTRLCTDGHPSAASFLLGKCRRIAAVVGIDPPLYSYLRFDECGTCYRAAGWVEVADVKGREWTSGNKQTRWLPGLYEPGSEVVDRTRWEVRW